MTAVATITPIQLGAEVIRQARLFLHLVETRPNSEWDDLSTPAHEVVLADALKESMRAMGWQPGQPYCIAFAGGVTRLALIRLGGMNHPGVERLQKLVCPHVRASFNACKKAGLISAAPKSGALWLAGYTGSTSGHAGVVEYSSSMTFRGHAEARMSTIEGNTSDTADGDQREGEGIFAKSRDQKKNGKLITLGFINPEVWL